MNEELIEVIGMIDSYGYQRSNLRWKLDKCKGKKVRCRVNSTGGDINQALLMSQMMADHGEVTVEFIGFVASAATFMAFGAKSITAAADSFWLGHKSSMLVDIYGYLNSDQLEETIKQLQSEKKSHDAIDLMIASKYYDRCKKKNKTLKDVFSLMKENRWMSAKEALEWGFIDSITVPSSSISEEDRARMVQNCADLHLPSLPEEVLNSLHKEHNDDLVERIINGVKNLFKNNQETPKVNKTMDSKFTFIAAALALAALTSENGKVAFDEEQLQKLDDIIKENEQNKLQLKVANEKLNAIGENIAKMATIEEKVAAVAEIASKMPGTAVPSAVVPEKPAPGVQDFAKDEVTSFLEARANESIY